MASGPTDRRETLTPVIPSGSEESAFSCRWPQKQISSSLRFGSPGKTGGQSYAADGTVVLGLKPPESVSPHEAHTSLESYPMASLREGALLHPRRGCPLRSLCGHTVVGCRRYLASKPGRRARDPQTNPGFANSSESRR